MNDDQYWDLVDMVIASLPERSKTEETAWHTHIVRYWREEVAPEKNADYGIDCWEYLGPKALVADLSAVAFRYKKLYRVGEGKPAMGDVVVDSFGYAVIYAVCCADRFSLRQIDLEDIYEESFSDPNMPAMVTNELIKKLAWDNERYIQAIGPSMRQAYNIWRGVKP